MPHDVIYTQTKGVQPLSLSLSLSFKSAVHRIYLPPSKSSQPLSSAQLSPQQPPRRQRIPTRQVQRPHSLKPARAIQARQIPHDALLKRRPRLEPIPPPAQLTQLERHPRFPRLLRRPRAKDRIANGLHPLPRLRNVIPRPGIPILPADHAAKVRVATLQRLHRALDLARAHEAIPIARRIEHAHDDAAGIPALRDDALVAVRRARVAEAGIELRVVPGHEFCAGAGDDGLAVEVEVGEAGQVAAARGQGRGDGGHGDEEGGALVGVEGVDEAQGYGDVDVLFDVQVQAVEAVVADDVGEEGLVVGLEL